jgi:hypothetical protein
MADKVPTEAHVREFARDCVRSGLLDGAQLQAEIALAVRSELGREDAESVAADWIEAEQERLHEDQRDWPAETDYDLLQAALAELEGSGVVVMQGVEDHWSAKEELDRRGAVGDRPRGIAWFTPSDVWHAIDEGMLEVNLWHGSTANAAEGDRLLDDVVAVLERHGLPAHFDEGRIEVSTYWRRRAGQ